MRCDHSLLGGDWTTPPPKGRKPRVKEPIFAIFTMLEAIRLVEPDPGKPRLLDAQKRALNIGLGVGTAPTAMIAHGINTTILELDPVVHEFAVKYFGLPNNHTFVIGDALQTVQQMIKNIHSQYDIVIHDVFTGGADPVDLFTLEFLSNLSALLKPAGVIAIVRNYHFRFDKLPSS
jgi:spermidine synthase